MQRNSFVKMTKLPNVKGRIYYISSPARQENLYAVYETTERSFWTDLARCNQADFLKSGTEGKCIEARELIIALPESFVEYEPDKLLKLFTDHFKDNYGTECIAALHHNKRKTNYHIHLIFSERKLLEEPEVKIASRNMFYDESGKHVRTKKEILDDKGQIRQGCKVIPKGEVYEKNIFAVKEKRFKSESFLDEVKQSYTDLINLYVRNDKEKLNVFDRNGVYLPTKKIGKNNPKAEEIKADNEVRMQWNQVVDQALVCGLSEQQILHIKREQIAKIAYQSIKQSGRHPGLFTKIVLRAIEALKLIIGRFFRTEVEKPEIRLEMQALNNTTVQEQMAQEPKQMQQKETLEAAKSEQRTERRIPKQSEKASRYLRLADVYEQLDKQNFAIHKKEQEIENLEQELAKTKGLFKGRQKKELQEQIEHGKLQLSNMRQYLQRIVKPYHYDSVKDFMRDYNSCKAEYESYQKELKDWKNGGQIESGSIRERLAQNVKEVKEREQIRQNTIVSSKDRGSR